MATPQLYLFINAARLALSISTTYLSIRRQHSTASLLFAENTVSIIVTVLQVPHDSAQTDQFTQLIVGQFGHPLLATGNR